MSEARSGDATAIILAGGRGTRLASVVSDRPKPLADVGGRPFITRLLDQLAAANIRESILCTGHMGELIADELGDAYGEMVSKSGQHSSPCVEIDGHMLADVGGDEVGVWMRQNGHI